MLHSIKFVIVVEKRPVIHGNIINERECENGALEVLRDCQRCYEAPIDYLGCECACSDLWK